MDILDKAKELGNMIADSEEMTILKACEDRMHQDMKSETLMNDYKLLQIELVKASKENRDPNIVETIKERLLSKQEEINEYEVTSNFLKAKSGFDSLMKQINDVILFTITGEEKCSPNKCSSCGGGCK